MTKNKIVKSESGLVPRPPVVAVMGHVDHGKSTLVEAIREIKITAKEQGGITQHIGAYQVNYQGKPITFIDTPGHAAFAAMRSRGAQVTDLVVLVVAADDGVMPQTKESLTYIRQAGVPMVVAINKIDLPEAAIDKVKSQLGEAGVYVEGYGGNVVCVPISAKTKQNLPQLLEMILLVAEMQELKANPQGKVSGVVIEAGIDPKQGPVTTVVVKNGTLKVGQEIWAEKVSGKVRAMFDDEGRRINSAGPSQPVRILGFKEVPPVGVKVSQDQEQEVATELAEGERESAALRRVVIKADVAGSVEAIKANLNKAVEVMESGTGKVNEANVLLAETTGARILAFNTAVSKSAQELAELEGVEIKQYSVIYELLEEVDKWVEKVEQATVDEEDSGQAKIVAEWLIKGERIAGCHVEKGAMNQGSRVRLKRGEISLGEAKITSLKQGKNTVAEVRTGEECGLVTSPQLDFKIGDMIVSYRKLSVN